MQERALVGRRALMAGPLLWALLTCFALAQAPPNSLDLTGTWKGQLGGSLRIVLTITKAASGDFSGKLVSLDQNATLPMANVTQQDDVVRFEVKQVGGIYQGKLNLARTAIDGTWTQTGASAQPLNFERETADATSKDAGPKTKEGPKNKPLVVMEDALVPIAPTAFKADGKWHLVYELHLNNMDGWDHKLTKVETLSGDSAARSLALLSGAELEAAMILPGRREATDKSKLSPGTSAVVYIWVTVDSEAALPQTIRHRISVKVGTYPEELTVVTPAVPVLRGGMVISPPLKGDHWLAANGPSNSSAHRRALIPVDGHAVISQRFAIDWVQLRDDGKTFQGDEKDNKNYRCYGSEALAVADGVVTEVKDGIPQNVPGENSRAVPITLETIGGNHVILDIGNGNYAFYAHLQPGSLRVKLGDKVRRGQVVGLVGNSGNSTEPHLHFHIENANSPLGAEGLPYRFSSFDVIAHGEWKAADKQQPVESRKNEIPLEDEVVNFPAKQ